MQKLRIGKIPYANLFPYFYLLEKKCDREEIEFIDGHPSELNLLLRKGEIDISPSSSIEYLKNEAIYEIIESHSVSSEGKVESIILFSNDLLKRLDGRTILVTSRSETSVAMLGIILRKFYNLDIKIIKGDPALSEGLKLYPAYLLIGDDAMIELYRNKEVLSYDIGEIWYKYTGLPSVFALWIVRKDSKKKIPHLIERFKKELDRVKTLFPSFLIEMSEVYHLSEIIGKDNLINYWKSLSYDLTERHLRGLELFKKYAKELGFL